MVRITVSTVVFGAVQTRVFIWVTDCQILREAALRHTGAEAPIGFPQLRNCIPLRRLSPFLICPSVRTGAPSPREKAWALPRQRNLCNLLWHESSPPVKTVSLQGIRRSWAWP